MQAQDRYDRQNRYDPYERPQNPYERLAQLEPGTFVTVRTRQPIDTDRRDGRVFTGVVERDVWDDYRRLAIPAIPRGSFVELIVRTACDGDLILDLDSVVVGGQRYAVTASAERIDTGERRGNNNDTAEFVGGGALLGTIIGAIAGGGKGAVIGAAAGAAAGAVGVMTQGRFVRAFSAPLLSYPPPCPAQHSCAKPSVCGTVTRPCSYVSAPSIWKCPVCDSPLNRRSGSAAWSGRCAKRSLTHW